MKLFRLLRGLYEPLLVFLVVGAAAVLLYALYLALSGGHRDSLCFDASFDDVSGIKERSSVLFKGMPVGSVDDFRTCLNVNAFFVMSAE